MSHVRRSGAPWSSGGAESAAPGPGYATPIEEFNAENELAPEDLIELDGNDLELQDEHDAPPMRPARLTGPRGQAVQTAPDQPVASYDQAIPPHEQVVLHPQGVDPMAATQMPGANMREAPYDQPFSYTEEDDVVTGESEVTGENELDAEPTRIESDMQGLEEEAQERPRLVTIGGNDRGKEFPLENGDNGIGRGLDNVVVLADIAVSRKHTLICQEANQFVLRDLGSGNGTLINGERVHTHTLKDGDQIELGNTLLRFVLPQAALADAATVVGQVEGLLPASTAPDPNVALRTMDVQQLPAEALPPAVKRGPLTRRQKLLIFGGGGVFFLLILMVGAKVVLKKKPAPPNKSQVDPRAEVAKHYDLGVKYFRMQKWAKARKHYLRVFAIAPGFEDAKTYAKRAAEEMKARDDIAEAKKAIAAKNFNSARDSLAKIPSGSHYAPTARTLKQRCDDEQLAKLLMSAKALKESGDLAGALVKIKEARRIAPTNLIVKKLHEELEGSTETTPTRVASKRPKTHRGRRTGSKPRRHHGASSSGGRAIRVSGAGISKALAAYRRKEWGVAYSALTARASALRGRKSKKVKSLAKAVQQVGMNYGRGLKSQVSNPSAALRYYKIALKYDRKIPRAPHQAMLKKQLFKVAKISATTSFSNGNYPSTYRAIKTAKSLGGLDSTLKNLLKRLDKKAMALFTRGYTMRARSPKKARSIWQTVLRMVPPKSAAYQKAYSWLNNSTPRYQDEDED